MAIIPLRSPRYEILTAPATSNSAKLELSIDSTLRYTIIKDCTAGNTVTFEISELCRDYIEPRLWNLSNSVFTTLSKIDIDRDIKFYTGANATGSQVGSTNSASYDGFDGYGDYIDGANFEIPEGASNAFLMSKLDGNYEVFYPDTFPSGVSIWLEVLDSSEQKAQLQYTSGTEIVHRSSTATVNRFDCKKYDPTLIYFVNKFGAIQQLWFTSKEVEILNTTQESYQRNTIDTSTTTASYFRPTYSTYPTNPHPIKTYEKNGKKIYQISSGYYPERANVFFEELLLSEYVWINKDLKAIPVKVVTSNFTYKTSLNDKLIEYTIEFEEAFDHINNIR